MLHGFAKMSIVAVVPFAILEDAEVTRLTWNFLSAKTFQQPFLGWSVSTTIFYLEKIDDPGKLLVSLRSTSSCIQFNPLSFLTFLHKKNNKKLTSKWSKKSTLLQTHPPFSQHLSQNWFIYWIPLKILKKPNSYPLTLPTHPHPSPPPNPTKACETSRPPTVSVVDLLLAASRPRSSTVPRTKDPWEHSCRGGRPRT